MFRDFPYCVLLWECCSGASPQVASAPFGTILSRAGYQSMGSSCLELHLNKLYWNKERTLDSICQSKVCSLRHTCERAGWKLLSVAREPSEHLSIGQLPDMPVFLKKIVSLLSASKPYS